MTRLYVIDTNALISYFSSVFGEKQQLSKKAYSIIRHGIEVPSSNIRLSIPSVCFVEIFEKWLLDEEFAARFNYEVYIPIRQSPNIEIKPLEREVVENILLIDRSLESQDIHDKIVLASAMMLKCPLITTDSSIIDYVSRNNAIPGVLT
jgi:hypothetical protein